MRQELERVGGRRRVLAPLVYATGTDAVVVDGVLLLPRNWRLLLLQVVPAVWIWLITYDLKEHLLSDRQVDTRDAVPGLALATGVTQAAVLVWAAGPGEAWSSVALTAILVAQIYLFIAVPAGSPAPDPGRTGARGSPERSPRAP